MDPARPTVKVELTMVEAQALCLAFVADKLAKAQDDADVDGWSDVRDGLGLYPESTVPVMLEEAMVWTLQNALVASRTPATPPKES